MVLGGVLPYGLHIICRGSVTDETELSVDEVALLIHKSAEDIVNRNIS